MTKTFWKDSKAKKLTYTTFGSTENSTSKFAL